jgi:hypothetical protein
VTGEPELKPRPQDRDPLTPVALAEIAKHRAHPERMAEPDCEANGWCETRTLLREEPEAWLAARYPKSKPSAFRFMLHVRGPMSCWRLEAVALAAWPETGMAAGGERCRFASGGLAGLDVLIERNRDPQIGYWPGIHVFSKSYLERDASFARALANYESRPAR